MERAGRERNGGRGQINKSKEGFYAHLRGKGEADVRQVRWCTHNYTRGGESLSRHAHTLTRCRARYIDSSPSPAAAPAIAPAPINTSSVACACASQ
jgi:hypothetical protein